MNLKYMKVSLFEINFNDILIRWDAPVGITGIQLLQTQ